MMGLTLGVKNTFGFIHAFDKAKWHLRAGKDRDLFAKVLIDIHNIVSPHITVLDCIIGMDGDCPSNSRVRTWGILCRSKNALALDHYVEKMIDLPFMLPVTKIADIKTVLRNLFIKKPKLKKDAYKKCGICKRVCPASAIYFSEEHIEFDYKKCIRCYCCLEMCLNNAIKI